MQIQWDNKPNACKVGTFSKGDVFQYETRLYLHCGLNDEGACTVVNLETGDIQTMAVTVNVLDSTAKIVVE